MDYIQDFKSKMATLFEGYRNDGCLEYTVTKDTYTVSKKDSTYMWAALDGAISLYNVEHPEAHLCTETSTHSNYEKIQIRRD